jgi:hypothetical protein
LNWLFGSSPIPPAPQQEPYRPRHRGVADLVKEELIEELGEVTFGPELRAERIEYDLHGGYSPFSA